jgi:hypothetical protein
MNTREGRNVQIWRGRAETGAVGEQTDKCVFRKWQILGGRDERKI